MCSHALAGRPKFTVDHREDLQTAILNNIPDMAWLKDKESRYLAVNEAYVATSGLTEKELLGRGPREVWPKEWAEVYLKTDQEVIRSGKRKRYEEQRYDKSGTLRWFDTIKSPFRNRRGEIVGTTGISRDITERKEVEEELARRNRFYSVRSQTNQAIARLSNRDDLLARTCKIIRRSGEIEAACVVLYGHATAAKPQLISHVPPPARKLRAAIDASSNDEFASLRRAGTRAWICDDTQRASRFPEVATIASALGYSSCAFFPLSQGEKRVGLFLLFAREPGFFSSEIAQLIRELCTDLSFALSSIEEAEQRRVAEKELTESRHQLRQLFAYLQEVREEERARISRELHDELGQTLTALTMGLEWVKKHLAPAELKVLNRVQALADLTQATAGAVRRIASDLRPLVLDELGLASAIEWLVETFAENNPIDIQLKSNLGTVDFCPEVNMAVFRILQESLTNVSRHGKASQVHVEVIEADGIITLRVSDNGRGIDPAHTASGKKLGLIGMRERAYMLGGSFRISSEESIGTVIEVAIPKNAKGAGRQS